MDSLKLTPNQLAALRGCSETEWRTHGQVKRKAKVPKLKSLRRALVALEGRGLVEIKPTTKGYEYRLKASNI